MDNRKVMATNISEQLEKKGINSRQMAQMLGFKYTTVRDWINGKTYPRVDKIEIMADFFGVEKSDLIEAKKAKNTQPKTSLVQDIMNIVQQLPHRLQEDVLSFSERKLAELVPTKVITLAPSMKEQFNTYVISGRVSAGRGYWQEEELDEEVVLPEADVPDKYDDIVQVVGDSMMPEYHNGDLLFIRYSGRVNFDQIGIFKYNGENFFKKLRRHEDGSIYLESLNPTYDDISVSEDDELKALGQVVGYYRENHE
jgi:phage repressor protein C with HTH and peptisase S24 domain